MKKQYKYHNLKIFIHLIFWMISVCFWSFIFNPTTSDYGNFGPESYWQLQLLVIFLFYIYSILPFIWLIKKVGKKIKIAVTALFLAVFLLLVVERTVPGLILPKFKDISDLFFEYFLYVVIFHFTITGAVYFNIKILIEKYLNKNRFGLYLVTLAALIPGSSLANIFLFDYLIDPIFPGLFYISYLKLSETIIVTTLYLVFTTSMFLILRYRHFLIAEREKSRNELSALKSQINPHFLFNNLNTVYSLASANDVRTKDVVMQLSDYLRYVLYDTASDEITLEKEIGTIKTYVDLQKERLNATINVVDLKISGNFNQVLIAPLLLLPLAENCFKHGIRKEGGKIVIDIRFDGKTLWFSTENPVAANEVISNGNNGGLGISNVEKRLNLIYPDRHWFHFEENKGIFRLELSIRLL